MTYTQTSNLSEINGLILEDHPYILPFEILKYASDGKLVVQLPENQVYYNQHFAELLQVVSTLGSYCVALHMDEADKKAFLAEKLRIRKLNFSRLEEQKLTVTAMPVLHNKRSAKAIINISADTEMLYSYELDYTVFTEQAFQKVFQGFYKSESITAESQSKLPSTLIKLTDNTHFSISMGPYRMHHCAGHFHQYPIVPAVFIVNGLLSSIREWLSINTEDASNMTVDSVELFPYKAVPIDTEMKAEISVKKLSPKTTLFTCSIMDNQNMEYGNYLITFGK